MEKKLRLILVIALVAGTSLAISSCDSVFGLVFKPDLAVAEVEPLMDGTDALTGVRILFENSGLVAAPEAEYHVVISPDQTIDISDDPIIYIGAVQLDGGAERQIDVSYSSDILPWLEANVEWMAGGTRYLGVFMDGNDRIEEKEETNNELASDVSFDFPEFAP